MISFPFRFTFLFLCVILPLKPEWLWIQRVQPPGMAGWISLWSILQRFSVRVSRTHLHNTRCIHRFLVHCINFPYLCQISYLTLIQLGSGNSLFIARKSWNYSGKSGKFQLFGFIVPWRLNQRSLLYGKNAKSGIPIVQLQGYRSGNQNRTKRISRFCRPYGFCPFWIKGSTVGKGSGAYTVSAGRSSQG